MVSSFLLFNLCLCFLRSYHTPEFVECVHVKRHIVNLTFVVRYRWICITIKFCKTIYIIPYGLIGCVENMRTILMNIDIFYLIGIDISCNMISFVNHQTCFSGFFCFVCKYSTKQSCSYDQIVILLHDIVLLLFSFFILLLLLQTQL